MLNYKWFLILLSAAIFVLSDTLSASWGKTGNRFSLIAMLITAPLGYIAFAILNKNTTLSVSSGLVNIFLLIGTICVGIFYFGDSLTIRQGAGLVFATVAVVLLAKI
jgi:hypothetical protein